MTRIQHRRGTQTQWTTANPVLASGEKGFETDTGKFKMGDGVTAWAELPYFLDQIDADQRYALKGSGGGTFSGNADDLADGTTKVVMTLVERNKLDGIEAGATANADDADLLDRQHHQGEQPISSVTGLQAVVDDTVRKSGSIKQLADVSDTAPDQGDALIFDPTPNAYVPTDLSSRFAQVGADGRLAAENLPLFYVPTIVLPEGELPPANFPVGGLIGYKGAPAVLTPTFLKDGVVQGASSLSLTMPQGLSVGDKVGVAIVSSNEAATNVLAAFTAAFSSGAASVEWAGWNTQTSAYAIVQALLTVTTAVPSGASLVITPRDSANAAISRPHLLASAFKLPNLAASSAIDQVAIAGGGSSSNLNVIGASSTVDISQVPEIVIGLAGFNGGTGTVTKTLTALDGFTQISQIESDTGTASRSLYVGYKVLSSVVKPSFTTQMDASDGVTGSWCANLVSYKGAVS